jgi:hypothetical protein
LRSVSEPGIRLMNLIIRFLTIVKQYPGYALDSTWH